MSIYFSVDINILFLLLGVCLKIIFSFLSIEQEYKGAGSETSKKNKPRWQRTEQHTDYKE